MAALLNRACYPITKHRGKLIKFRITPKHSDPLVVKVMPTFHPSYVMRRRNTDVRDVWMGDLSIIKEYIT